MCDKEDDVAKTVLLELKRQTTPSAVHRLGDATATSSEPTDPLLLKVDQKETPFAHSAGHSELADPINTGVEPAMSECDQSAFSDVDINDPDSEMTELRTLPPDGELLTSDLGSPPSVLPATRTYGHMPRTLTIAKVHSSQPAAESSNYSVETFDVCHTVFDRPLYRIRSWKDVSLGGRSPRLCMELVRAKDDHILSRWNTPPGFTSCVCCCWECAPDLRQPGGVSPEYSLRIESPAGVKDGHLRLVNKTINVLGSNDEILYNIGCQPSSNKKYQIIRDNAPPVGSPTGFSMFNHQEAWIQLPSTNTESHVILLLAGVFALHFMRLYRPSHLEIRPEEDCCKDGLKCMKCVLCCCECVRSTLAFGSSLVNCFRRKERVPVTDQSTPSMTARR